MPIPMSSVFFPCPVLEDICPAGDKSGKGDSSKLLFFQLETGGGITFLRRTKTPDVPYYTLEVEPGGTVHQKRTVNDTQDEHIGEITAFLAEWQAAIQPRLSEADKQLSRQSQALRVQEFAELRQNKVEVRNGFLRGKLLADVLEADLLEIGFAKLPELPAKKERSVG